MLLPSATRRSVEVRLVNVSFPLAGVGGVAPAAVAKTSGAAMKLSSSAHLRMIRLLSIVGMKRAAARLRGFSRGRTSVALLLFADDEGEVARLRPVRVERGRAASGDVRADELVVLARSLGDRSGPRNVHAEREGRRIEGRYDLVLVRVELDRAPGVQVQYRLGRKIATEADPLVAGREIRSCERTGCSRSRERV